MDLKNLIEEVRAIPGLPPVGDLRFSPAERQKFEPFFAMYEVVSRLHNALAEWEPETEVGRKPRPDAVAGRRGLEPEPEETAKLFDEPEGFCGEIVTEAGSGTYTFKEKSLTDGTTWADTSDGREGTVYEINGLTGIGVGRLIHVTMKWDTGGNSRYVFEVPLIVGTANNDLLYWDHTNKVWVPLAASASGNYVLATLSGVLQWVELTAFVCPE